MGIPIRCFRSCTFAFSVRLYIHFPVHCEPPLSAERKIRRNCRHKFYPQPFLIPVFNFSHKRPTFAFTPESGYTLGFANRIAHSGSQGETGAFRAGVVSLPSDWFVWFGNPAWPGVRTANFAAFGSWSEALPKNAESQRNSDVLMRIAVPRRRGPAGLRDLFLLLSKLWLYALCLGLSARTKEGVVLLPSECSACC